MSTYITSSGRFLPGPAIDNDQIETHLGMIAGKPSRLKKRILDSNRIRTRHYAIDAAHNTLFSNAKMAANAAEDCIAGSSREKNDISLLSCATSQGDLVLPGFGSMVQAELNIADVELHTSHGICSSSMMALKHAFLSLQANEHKHALVIASELTSRLFKAARFEAVDEEYSNDFNAEFLRWTLSDGAGAVLLEDHPVGICFRIDWIRGFSHADAFPVCMSVGSTRNPDETRNWQDFPSYADAERAGALLIRQDVRQLDNIVKLGVDGFLRLIDENVLLASDIDHVLCHYSSDYFRGRIFDMLTKAGVGIPEQKWYTNLYTRGNTGCASIFIMLDEFRRTQSYKPGDKILCMVPESGRFNTTYALLTVEQA